MSRTLITIKRVTLELGPEVGRGGEGIVYRLRNRSDLALKLYHPGQMTKEHRRKLEVMVDLANDELVKHAAWPIDLVQDGTFGVVMPLVEKPLEIHDVYGPKSRMTKLPEAGFKFLLLVGYNLCAAVKYIHAAGVVIGDFNQRNILVTRDARVRFVDCDSFQIRRGNELFRCLVGTPDQLAPEAHNRPLDQIIREPEHDNFTLAVIIFQLLFAGRHPFAGVGGPPEIQLAIQRYLYAYGGQGAKSGIRPPPHAPSLDLLPPNLIQLFERAFAPPHERISRPSPDEWAQELRYALEHVVQCRVNPAHEFVAGRMSCPWCDLENRFQIFFFTHTTTTVIPNQGLNFRELVEQLLQIGPPTWTGRATPRPTPTSVASIPAKSTWPASYWFGFALLAVAAIASGTGHWIIALAIAAWGAQTALSSLGGEEPIVKDARKAVKTAEQQREQSLKQVQNFAASVIGEFEQRRTNVRSLRSEYDNLSNEKTKRYTALRQQHSQLQLEQYLDKFFVAHASISGIGPRRKSTLLSYSIETAADVHQNMGIPGFGRDLEYKLIAWRTQLEQQFRFNPAQQIDPAEFRKIDVALAARRQEFERKLVGKKDEIEQATRNTNKELQSRAHLYEMADNVLAQKQADLATLSQQASTPNGAAKAVLMGWAASLIIVTIIAVNSENRPRTVVPVAANSIPTSASAKLQTERPAPYISSVGEQPKTKELAVSITSHLLVRTNRPNVEIELQPYGSSQNETANRVEQTFYDFTNLSPGIYRLTGRLVGWPVINRVVTLGPGQDLEVPLEFKGGSLRIESDPLDAIIIADGRILGRTPILVSDLPPGKQKFSLQYKWWPEHQVVTTIQEGNETKEVVRIPHGRLTIESTPSGAVLLIDGQRFGETPLTLEQIPAGTKQIRLTAEDYDTTELSLSIEDRDNLKIRPVLSSNMEQLDPDAMLTSLWLENQGTRKYEVASSFGGLSSTSSRNGVIRNLNRGMLDAKLLGRKFRYASNVKSFDQKSGLLEFSEHAGAKSKYRVSVVLSPETRSNKNFTDKLLKGAAIEISGRLAAVEEPRWPSKTIVFEIGQAEPIR